MQVDSTWFTSDTHVGNTVKFTGITIILATLGTMRFELAMTWMVK